MSGPTPRDILSLLKSQLTYHCPPTTASFAGQTVIITGANAGLGREVVKQLVNLDVQHVIMAVRTVSKGEEAQQAIESETGRKGILEVWPLDMANFQSIRNFTRRAQSLPRIDAVLANAGQWPKPHETAEGHELTLLVNVISTCLLAKLLLPKMRESAKSHQTTSRFTVVGSALHKFASLTARKESKHSNIIDALDRQPLLKSSDFDGRYNDTKLLVQMYCTRLAAEEESDKYVSVSTVNPGWCVSNLKPAADFGTRVSERVLARSTEEGARIIVDAITLGQASARNGGYIDECVVKKPSSFLESKDGKVTAERVWRDLNAVIDRVMAD